ncbi:MAG: hypothetical protein WCO84_09890 [bacterium]
MILTFEELYEQELQPVDEYGDVIGCAYEVDTDTKIAKCYALFLRDHPDVENFPLPPVEGGDSAIDSFLKAAGEWQRANTPVYYRFDKLVPTKRADGYGLNGKTEAVRALEAKNNLPLVVREHLGFHNPKTVISS